MQRASLLKLFAILGLSFTLMIALVLVGSVVNDREQYRAEAVKSISESYAGEQTIIGPVLGESYLREKAEVTVENGKPKSSVSLQPTRLIVFPRTMQLSGEMKPSERHHGLYSVTVYEFTGHMEGDFDVPPPTITNVTYQQPYLEFALSDFRGIVGLPTVTVNGQKLPVSQAKLAALKSTDASIENTPLRLAESPALVVPLPQELAGKAGRLHYSIELVLGGTQQLFVAPVADSNEIHLSSSWPSPLFGGSFLPRQRSVTNKGFEASWQISSLASATQQELPDKPGELISISLLQPVDPYKMSSRAVKYGVLFILLTFGSFFVFEVMKDSPIHPVQYLLVGLALVIFFLLLISFSEHIAFGAAYLIASVACIGLLVFYLSFVLKGLKRGVSFGGMLAVMYLTIYGLLISEDNALLLGALMLFAILGAVMYVTRHVDWYKGAPPSTPAA